MALNSNVSVDEIPSLESASSHLHVYVEVPGFEGELIALPFE